MTLGGKAGVTAAFATAACVHSGTARFAALTPRVLLGLEAGDLGTPGAALGTAGGTVPLAGSLALGLGAVLAPFCPTLRAAALAGRITAIGLTLGTPPPAFFHTGTELISLSAEALALGAAFGPARITVRCLNSCYTIRALANNANAFHRRSKRGARLCRGHDWREQHNCCKGHQNFLYHNHRSSTMSWRGHGPRHVYAG
ncbi:MAG: hypothetical protein ROR55_16200 [Devosia sp.]